MFCCRVVLTRLLLVTASEVQLEQKMVPAAVFGGLKDDWGGFCCCGRKTSQHLHLFSQSSTLKTCRQNNITNLFLFSYIFSSVSDGLQPFVMLSIGCQSFSSLPWKAVRSTTTCYCCDALVCAHVWTSTSVSRVWTFSPPRMLESTLGFHSCASIQAESVISYAGRIQFIIKRSHCCFRCSNHPFNRRVAWFYISIQSNHSYSTLSNNACFLLVFFHSCKDIQMNCLYKVLSLPLSLFFLFGL